MPDDTVIEVLEQALADDPHNVTIRAHLAGLLLDGGRHGDALAHARAVLASIPDHQEGLAVAARAAEAAGDLEQAAAYRRLLLALELAALPTAEGPAVEERPPEPPADDDVVEEPAVSLTDVGGLDEVKRRLQISFLGPARSPELRSAYGTTLRGGLLLWGPPGCGKTFLARALAGELGAGFIGVGLADVLDVMFAASEQRLHWLFDRARRASPCVLFFDEVDALGQRRSNLRYSPGRNVVVQLLQELDGLQARDEGTFVLGATNQPWDVDPALRRPGRFDRTLLVLPPDRAARQAILATHLAGRPTEGIDVGRWAERTEGFSGADLRLLCDGAAELALEDSLSSGQRRPVQERDLSRARREVQPSTTAWFRVARNHALFANQDGQYDELLAHLRANKLL